MSFFRPTARFSSNVSGRSPCFKHRTRFYNSIVSDRSFGEIENGNCNFRSKGVVSKMFWSKFILLLSGAYLGLAFGEGTPVFHCAATFDSCPLDVADSSRRITTEDCCTHEDGTDSRPGCCVAVSENREGWLLPSGVKVPKFTHFEWYTIIALAPEQQAVFDTPSTSAGSPDPPGPAGRILLIRVSRQLV